MPPIRLRPAAQDTPVLLRDPDRDVEVKYTPNVLTRSRKKELAALESKLDDLKAADAATEDAEEQSMRLLCDMLNVVLGASSEDTPAAGDFLYEAWLNDQITDDQIVGLVEDLTGATPDPS